MPSSLLIKIYLLSLHWIFRFKCLQSSSPSIFGWGSLSESTFHKNSLSWVADSVRSLLSFYLGVNNDFAVN